MKGIEFDFYNPEHDYLCTYEHDSYQAKYICVFIDKEFQYELYVKLILKNCIDNIENTLFTYYNDEIYINKYNIKNNKIKNISKQITKSLFKANTIPKFNVNTQADLHKVFPAMRKHYIMSQGV